MQCILLPPLSREEALHKMVARLVQGTDLEEERTYTAVLEREATLSSRVSPQIAMPHAILPERTETLVILGICPDGIDWDSRDEPIQILVLLVGPEATHLETMAILARQLQSESVVEALLGAATEDEAQRILSGKDTHRATRGHRAQAVTAATVAHAAELARVLPNDPIVVSFAGPGIRELLGPLGESPLAERTLLVGPAADDGDFPEFPRVLSIDHFAGDGRDRALMTLLPLVATGMLSAGAEVILLSGRNEESGLEAVRLVDVSRDLQVPEGLEDSHLPEGVRLDVVIRALHLAAELGIQGREGKSVGTILVIGDDEALEGATQQMILNPFAGYPPSERNILDPSLTETLKELAKIDGAFIISGDGTIRSAGTHLAGRPDPREMEAGLGARHAAALGITAIADVLAICLSESTGFLTLFHGGRRITRR